MRNDPYAMSDRATESWWSRQQELPDPADLLPAPPRRGPASPHVPPDPWWLESDPGAVARAHPEWWAANRPGEIPPLPKSTEATPTHRPDVNAA